MFATSGAATAPLKITAEAAIGEVAKAGEIVNVVDPAVRVAVELIANDGLSVV
jgi:hypothetical protein